jgi:hypothetical protein
MRPGGNKGRSSWRSEAVNNSLVPVDSSDSLLATLPEEVLTQLVRSYGVMETSRIVSQAVQEAMASNQLHAFFTGISTVDMATRVLLSSPVVAQAFAAEFFEMQETYLKNVGAALATANKAILAQQEITLEAVLNGGGATR